MTEAERAQKREETARKRKRQTEQKLQDEQVCKGCSPFYLLSPSTADVTLNEVLTRQDQTINRLLRAQTGRSRAKLDAEPGEDGDNAGAVSGNASPTKRPRRMGNPDTMIRWSSKMEGEKMVIRVAAPVGKDDWIALGVVAPTLEVKEEKPKITPPAACAVTGCGNARKYRSTKQFDKGGCSMEHLKMVNEGLAMQVE